MDWFALFLVVAGIAGVLLFIYGLRGKSVLLLFFGATALIALLFYFINLKVFLPLAPPLAMLIAYFIKKRMTQLKFIR